MKTKKVSKKQKDNAVLHGFISRLHFASVMLGLTIIGIIMMMTFTWTIYWLITGTWFINDFQKIADRLP
ncbi:MAG: hypothetical protein WC319_08560 [Candidatus Paceibacterota bacterium]|jgi:Na+/proline symporter